MAKNIQIHVEDGAFKRDAQRTLLSDEIEAYNRKIADMNKAVEALDRYDDFSMLKIDAEMYGYDPETQYGIKVVQGFNDGVILSHQKKAALAFLQELRGFGLLADVVGSGKTFEAGVVLSELAVRDKVHSLLIVAPEQVYDSWIDVLEEKFGLGRGMLHELDKNATIRSVECQNSNGFLRPSKPMIVKTEDFVEWGEDMSDLLFDVIIVDEAHNLCVEEGKYAKAMKLLSLMMQIKKKANMTYCLLLSATPHSGNLDKMFRLWYFIRCQGGNPSDFDEKDDKLRTDDYRKEKKYYKEHVCRGAVTVMEFIKKVKLAEVCSRDEFDEYLDDNDIDDFDSLSEGERYSIVNEFLLKNEEIDTEVERAVANAYHNGVLRSIMIRQPHKALRKKKQVKNYFFFPMEREVGLLDTKGLRGEKIKIDLSDLYGDEAVSVEGKKTSLAAYIEDVRGDRSYKKAYAEMVASKIINAVGAKEPIFTKQGSGQYYWDQLDDVAPGVDCEIVPIKYDPDDAFSYKFEKAVEILRQHKDSRILVFFDYDLKKKDSQVALFEEELNKLKEFSDRIMTGSEVGKDATVKEFNEREDAILIIKDAAFTEGVNLQKSNIIINFQVTPDPLSMDQRIGRIFRLGQDKDVVIYSLADMNKLDGYVLMYFSRIGLMSSNSGDATIIAGSNNERMVTVRCNVCGNVKLYSQEDYEIKKKNGELYCTATSRCIDNGKSLGHGDKGSPMEEISTYNFKCDVCDSVFTRSVSEEGYLCMAVNDGSKGIMCNNGEMGNRSFYCNKICAVSHCKKFRGKEDQCAALKAYRSNPNIAEAELMLLCSRCKSPVCSGKKCKIDIGEKAIFACATCDEASCKPKPHAIKFDEKWEADCPVCMGERRARRGKIRPILARTFATYIRSAWDFAHDGGESFCKNLGREAMNVADIKNILTLDDED